MIYDIDGNELPIVYDIDGNELSVAYDIDGSEIWTQTQEEPDFVFMTYNTGGWYTGVGYVPPADDEAKYIALQTSIMDSAQADIACFNEYRYTMGESGASASTFLGQYFTHLHAENGSSSYNGRAIASNYPQSDYTVNTLTGETRYYDSCTVTVDNVPITVIVTHLHPTSVQTRQTEFAELMDLLETLDSFILCGDLNTEFSMDKNGADYQGIIKPLLDAGYKCANCGNFGFKKTYFGSSKELCLDHIVVSPNLKIVSVRTENTKLTDDIDDTVDHIPLIAGIKFVN